MPHQPNLFSSPSPHGSAAPVPPPPPHTPSRIPLWLRRLELFLYVVIRIYVGVVILLLPWTPLWASNHILNYFPPVSAFLMHGAVRGVVSGLGLLNLWIAAEEALHYRNANS